MIIILMVAVIVIKPERLPEISYTFGRFIAKVRKFYHSFIHKYGSF